jgi:hypothetical protein
MQQAQGLIPGAAVLLSFNTGPPGTSTSNLAQGNAICQPFTQTPELSNTVVIAPPK